MRRQLLAAALFTLAPVGCKSVEVAVDYPGMHVAAKFEAHDKQPRMASNNDASAKKKAEKADKQSDADKTDSRPSITVML
jgi:hypothetical protein